VRSRWAATKGKDAVKRYKSRWPAKQRARILIQREVNAGRLVNPRVCSICSSTERVEAHHDDYALPFDIRWLCRLCHRAWHREHGHAANSNLSVPRE
jgi:transposase-like protein